MSDPSTLQQVYLHNYLHLVGISIFYYDYSLTFPNEYARIWRKPKTVGSWLFFLNRYLTFLGDIAVNVGNFYHFKTDKNCDRYALYRQCLLIGAQVIVCIILCLRTYALYHRSKIILAVVVGVGVTLAGLSVFAVTGQHQTTALNGGCHIAASRITGVRIAVAWESLFVYDVLIFSLTIFKTWKSRVVYAITEDRPNLVTLILRDGAVYFAVMASVNLANTLTFYFLQPLLRGVLSTFASSVSVAMMSRLMLNLHESASAHSTLVTAASNTENSTTLVFTSQILMGSELAPTGTDASGGAYGAADTAMALDTESEGTATCAMEMQDMSPRPRPKPTIGVDVDLHV